MVFSLLGLNGLSGQEPADDTARASLRLAAVSVHPNVVTAETLCQLEVEVRNDGRMAADALGFDVIVGGVSLRVYEGQLFLDPIGPRSSRKVRLFNFWSSEEGRDLPKEGPLDLRVVLREAQWVTVETTNETAEDGSEEEVLVWRSTGAVGGLPQEISYDIHVRR